MASLIRASSFSFPRRTYLNSAVSNVVTNTTTETVLDQFYTHPATNVETSNPNTAIRLEASGVMSTGILNLGFNFRMRWGGIGGTVIATTGGISVASSLSDGGWWFRSTIFLRNPSFIGTAECQSYGAFQGGALTNIPVFMPSVGTFSINTSTPIDVVLTAQWTTATASNQIQIRSFMADCDQPD